MKATALIKPPLLALLLLLHHLHLHLHLLFVPPSLLLFVDAAPQLQLLDNLFPATPGRGVGDAVQQTNPEALLPPPLTTTTTTNRSSPPSTPPPGNGPSNPSLVPPPISPVPPSPPPAARSPPSATPNPPPPPPPPSQPSPTVPGNVPQPSATSPSSPLLPPPPPPPPTPSAITPNIESIAPGTVKGANVQSSTGQSNASASTAVDTGLGSLVTAAIIIGAVVLASMVGIFVFRKWKLRPQVRRDNSLSRWRSADEIAASSDYVAAHQQPYAAGLAYHYQPGYEYETPPPPPPPASEKYWQQQQPRYPMEVNYAALRQHITGPS